MTYFCFLESDILSVPHMEPLAADDAEVAEREAADLLLQHASAYAAHVFHGDRRVATVHRTPPSSGRHPATARDAESS